MIRVNNLRRDYGDFTAVKSVSFEIGKGQIVGLLGHNGAGKTTILKMLTGYLEPTDGEVQIAGLEIKENIHQVQKKIGYLSENSPLYPEMRVWQYLEYVATLRGIDEQKRSEAILEAIKETGLKEKATAVIDTLSKGYRQRVGVAQAIIHKPQILILDEPTSGLDPSQIVAMRDLIKRLAKSATVILSTHILQEVEAICDRVMIVLQGKIALDSTLEELKKESGIYLSVNQEFSTLQPLLTSINGIKELQEKGANGNIRHYHISLDNTGVDEVTPKIASKICEKGWHLHNLRAEGRTLETIFKEVNKGTTGGTYV